jgi:hypothetical protein
VNVQEDIGSYHLAIAAGAQWLHASLLLYLMLEVGTVLSYLALKADGNILGIGTIYMHKKKNGESKTIIFDCRFKYGGNSKMTQMERGRVQKAAPALIRN